MPVLHTNASKKRATSRPQRRWLRWLLILAALPFFLCGYWVFIHWLDVAPSQAALSLAQPDPRNVPDPENAWMHLFGIGAPADEAPFAFARRRLAALAETPPRTLTDAIPAAMPKAAVHGVDALCPVRVVSCLDWSIEHADMLEELRQANAVRLQRWAVLMRLESWQLKFMPALDEPFADASVATLDANLAAYELAQALLRNDNAAQEAALMHLTACVKFWRGVQQGPQELIALMVAATQIETAQRISLDLFSRLSPSRRTALAALSDAVLLPPATAIDWSEVIRRQQQMLLLAIAPPSSITSVLGSCINGQAKNCFTELATAASIARQDTANRHAELLLGLKQTLDAPPSEVIAAKRKFQEQIERAMPPFESASKLLKYFSFNPAGKIVSVIAAPAFPYDARLDDYEGLRRMFLLAQAAAQQNLTPAALPGFLNAQPMQLHAVSGIAFGFDPHWNEVVYVPTDSTYWKRAELRVPEPFRAPPVANCKKPLQIVVADSDNSVASSQRFFGCGITPMVGMKATNTGNDAALSPAKFVVTFRRIGQSVNVRVSRTLNLGKLSYRQFEGTIDVSVAKPRGWLKAQGAGDEASLYLRLTPASG